MSTAEMLPFLPEEAAEHSAENESELYREIRREFADTWDNLVDEEHATFSDAERAYGDFVMQGEKIAARGNKTVEDILIDAAKRRGITSEAEITALLTTMLE